MGEIPDAMLEERRRMSFRYLLGNGVEVGALHHPMEIGVGSSVRYVDRMDVDGLRAQYPELQLHDLVPVDVVDDGERLGAIPDVSLDFVVANHFLEHTENPLGTMRNHLRKVRVGGVVYYAVPIRDYCFDRDRELTPFEHLVRDDVEGPAVSRLDHYREWARIVERIEDPAALEEQVRRLLDVKYSIHFHVWDAESFAHFLERANIHLGRCFEVKELAVNGTETIAVLGRTSWPAACRRTWIPGRASKALRGLAARLGGRKVETSSGL